MPGAARSSGSTQFARNSRTPVHPPRTLASTLFGAIRHANAHGCRGSAAICWAVVVVDRWHPSSKTCSTCGHRLEQLVLANWPLWLAAIVSGPILWRTRIHLLWLLAAGAVLGALGLI
jgi:hypothetical protein